MFEGKLIKRLKAPVTSLAAVAEAAPSGKNTGSRRLKDLAWRPHNVELYSAQADGSIRAWKPPVADDSDEGEELEEERIMKRKALDDIYADLAKRQMVP
jgi:DNA excision repair protein ERCC-8